MTVKELKEKLDYESIYDDDPVYVNGRPLEEYMVQRGHDRDIRIVNIGHAKKGVTTYERD